MISIMKTVKQLLIATLLPLFLFSCNNEDDVREIFSSGQTWHWVGNFVTNNGESHNVTPQQTPEELKSIATDKNSYILSLREDGSLVGKGKTVNFTGTWSADGKSRTFQCSITPNISPVGLDKVFIESLQETRYYKGDTQHIELYNAGKGIFVLLYNSNR